MDFPLKCMQILEHCKSGVIADKNDPNTEKIPVDWDFSFKSTSNQFAYKQ